MLYIIITVISVIAALVAVAILLSWIFKPAAHQKRLRHGNLSAPKNYPPNTSVLKPNMGNLNPAPEPRHFDENRRGVGSTSGHHFQYIAPSQHAKIPLHIYVDERRMTQGPAKISRRSKSLDEEALESSKVQTRTAPTRKRLASAEKYPEVGEREEVTDPESNSEESTNVSQRSKSAEQRLPKSLRMVVQIRSKNRLETVPKATEDSDEEISAISQQSHSTKALISETLPESVTPQSTITGETQIQSFEDFPPKENGKNETAKIKAAESGRLEAQKSPVEKPGAPPNTPVQHGCVNYATENYGGAENPDSDSPNPSTTGFFDDTQATYPEWEEASNAKAEIPIEEYSAKFANKKGRTESGDRTPPSEGVTEWSAQGVEIDSPKFAKCRTTQSVVEFDDTTIQIESEYTDTSTATCEKA